MKQMSLPDFLTEAQIQEAWKLYQTAESGTFATKCAEKIITPNLAAINKKLGQSNDARYLAYTCEYVFGQMPRK